MYCSEDYAAKMFLVYNLGALECLWAVTWLPEGGLPCLCVSWLCLGDSAGIVSAIYKRSFYDVCKWILLIQK